MSPPFEMLGDRASINVCTGVNLISGSQWNDGVDDARAAFGSMKSGAKMAVVTVSRSAIHVKVITDLPSVATVGLNLAKQSLKVTTLMLRRGFWSPKR
jgi:hypothetical protein